MNTVKLSVVLDDSGRIEVWRAPGEPKRDAARILRTIADTLEYDAVNPRTRNHETR